ncbi:MAG: YhfC family intramembrane metalloprotease [Ardenticatenaceae bacterium]|nr:YhfC family intramembrane metalloprotease [Ardenticatenaceae bacterium]
MMILLPLVTAVWLRRRFVVPWWLFCVGVLTFAGAQLVHLPVNHWLTEAGILPAVPEEGEVLRWALILGFTAGFFETAARAVGYWLLFRRHKAERVPDALMVGLGHGGFEAMGLIAVITAASVGSLLALRGTDLAALDLTAVQMAAVQQQLAALLASPWSAVLPLVERTLTVGFHVVLSLLVWLAFKRRRVGYGLLALGYHVLVDATAVYLSQVTEIGSWVLAVIALLMLPGLVWLWWRWPEADERVLVPLKVEWALLGVAVRKELWQQWRTKRVLVVTAVFLGFGLMSPLLAKFTPELLNSIEGAEQFADLIPTPTAADALGQYVKNITQFGFILAILLGMGAVAGEKERGMTAMILSKPLPRWAFVVSKFVAQTAVYLVAFLLAALGAYYYTLLLFGSFALGAFMVGNGLLLLWLLVFAAVTLLGSTIANSTGAAAGIGLVGSVLLLIVGSWPQLASFAPAGLVAWASQLGLAGEVTALPGALVANGVLVILLVLASVAMFETQEL